jgi:HAD superfamily hydrolase (TIGR01549 family)
MKLQGLIFDMDGTIVDAPYDWPRIRAHLDTKGQPILKYLADLSEPEKSRKWAVLESYEKQATERAVLKEGVCKLLNFLAQKSVLTALVSNNSLRNVRYLIGRFQLSFDRVLARDSGLWKPSAAPFLEVLDGWALSPAECGVVGDSHFDLQAAEAAAIRYVFIVNKDLVKFRATGAEVFGSLPALQERLSELV